MRLGTIALGVLLPAAAVLSGCGVGTLASPNAIAATSKAIKGKAFGGQQPVVGATIALYSFGTAGYGSAGTLLATATTDSGGYFTIDPASINCPTADTPVYILSLGGNPGSQVNSAIALGAGLGACSNAANAFVTINEINTAMLAYTFAHFFNASTPDGTTSDHFGAPASAAQVVANASNGTLNTLIDKQNGYPLPNTSTQSFEGAKLITLGNILGACVNSAGPGSPSCSALFSYSTPPTGAAPTNTLEAAIDVALYPAQNVPFIYALQPQSGAAAFTGGLTSAPADWTLSASYTSSSFGLGVNHSTASTIDIDSTGRVWFPSNGLGTSGVGFFDPASGAFSPLFAGGLRRPQEIAIDVDDYVWANDTASATIAGFPAASPTTPTVLSIRNTSSTAVTVALDNSIRYGIVATDGLPALAQVTGKNTYSQIPNTEIAGGGGFIASSLAADTVGGIGIGGQQVSTPTTYDLYYAPDGSITPVTYQTVQDAGQVVFTGSDFAQARGGYSPGDDGLCLFSAQNCFSMADPTNRHPSGVSLDGAGTLWFADNFTPTVEAIPLTNGSYLTSNNTANNTVYVHDSNNGGTLTGPAGIAVDGAGNVWVSNYGCYGTGCRAGAFTLSELIGAGAPTLTPVARQIGFTSTTTPLVKGKSAASSAK